MQMLLYYSFCCVLTMNQSGIKGYSQDIKTYTVLQISFMNVRFMHYNYGFYRYSYCACICRSNFECHKIKFGIDIDFD